MEAPVSDMEVAKNVLSSLNASVDIVSEDIDVAVTRGIVSLGGSVPQLWERLVAEELARSVQGVRDVRNCLSVNSMTERK